MVELTGSDVFLTPEEGLSAAEAVALNFELAFELGKLRPGTKRYLAVARDFHGRLKEGRYDALKASVQNRQVANPACI